MDFIHGHCACMSMDIHVLLNGIMVRDHVLSISWKHDHGQSPWTRPWSGFHDIVHGLHVCGCPWTLTMFNMFNMHACL